MTSDNLYSKRRTLVSLRTNREYVQHCLLGVHVLHALKMDVGKARITFSDKALDLTEYGRAFMKDHRNQKRFTQTVSSIMINGIVRAYETASNYFKHNHNSKWNKIRKNPIYLVAWQIRNMASHNFVWTYKNPERIPFPLNYKGISILREWDGKKARADLLCKAASLEIIQDIVEDVENS